MQNTIRMPKINDNPTREEMLALLAEVDACHEEVERIESDARARGKVGLMSYDTPHPTTAA